MNHHKNAVGRKRLVKMFMEEKTHHILRCTHSVKCNLFNLSPNRKWKREHTYIYI